MPPDMSSDMPSAPSLLPRASSPAAQRVASLAALRRMMAQGVVQRAGQGGANLSETPHTDHLTLGLPAIDDALGVGLVRGALHEILPASADREDAALPAAFAAFMAARAATPDTSAVLWCGSGRDLYPDALEGFGLDPAFLIIAEARRSDHILCAMEEGLKSGALAAVIGEVPGLDLTASRRLQLAAAKSATPAFVIHRAPLAPSGRETTASAAWSRWQVLPQASADPDVPLKPSLCVGAARWRLSLLRCRAAPASGFAAWPVEWCVEISDATRPFHLSAGLSARLRDEASGQERAEAG